MSSMNAWEDYMDAEGESAEMSDVGAYAMSDLFSNLMFSLLLTQALTGPLQVMSMDVSRVPPGAVRPLDSKRPRIVLSAMAESYQIDGQLATLEEITNRLHQQREQDPAVVLHHDAGVTADRLSSLIGAAVGAGLPRIHIRVSGRRT